MFQQQKLEGLLCPAARVDDRSQALALLGENLVLSASLRFEFRERRGGLGLGFESLLLGLGLGLDDDLGLLGLGAGLQRGALFGLNARGLGEGGAGEGAVLGLLHGGVGLALRGLG